MAIFRFERQPRPSGTLIEITLAHGVQAAAARHLRVDPSHVSRVWRGLRKSRRVRQGIFKYLAKNNGAR